MSLNIREYDLRREGRIEGEAVGFDKGGRNGLAEGARQKALETAAAFKKLGVELDTIAAGTGLSREEIAQL